MYRRRRARRGRYHPRGRWGYKRRWWRRFRRGGRRRTVRPRTVRQDIPKRHRTIVVRGWEPLGNLCASALAKTECTPYNKIDKGETGQFNGTWGKHYFTLNNLLLRGNAYWNTWSDNWASFDYVRFTGARILIPHYGTATWMINFDPYVEQLKTLGQKNANEDKWVHPGILLNTPGTHIILPPSVNNRRSFYKIKVKPPPGWGPYQRLPEAMGYICFHWVWSWFSLDAPFFNRCPQNQNPCEQAPWWASVNDKWNKWVDRSKYGDTCTSANENWGPFLPTRYGGTAPEQSVYFLYKLYFKFAGNCIWRPVPRNFANDGLIPLPPTQASTKVDTGSDYNSKKRPRDEADIWPGDLDSDGILTERAYKRITKHNPGVEFMSLGEQDRFRLLHDRVRGVLSKFNLLKRN